MNQLELSAIKFATLTFGKMWKISAIHIQVDNMISLIYLLKMGGTKNPEPMQISNEICFYLGRRSLLPPNIYQESQLQGRLEILAPERFHGMETMLTNYIAQQNMQNIRGKTGNRPICFKVDKSSSKLLFLKAGSQQSWQSCSSTEMV